jgi:A/G-specific adenine glycosylase
MAKQFQQLLLKWFDRHGRKHLPWQQDKTPYRVWISEIMLQQTQVNTVIPYFQRFMQRFPSLEALAAAPEDDVLHHWAGLGYYSRARNLHKAAKMIVKEFDGMFPNQFEQMITLPGIGPSTAGAILSIAFNHATAILDGNVKRVLTRFHAITGYINDRAVEDELWELAQRYTPQKRGADYTQAIMDLGATLCTRSKPQCDQCPLLADCAAHEQGIVSQLPKKRRARKLPIRTATFLIIKHGQRVWLEKRPAKGIWGGLWSVPELTGVPDDVLIKRFCQQHIGQLPINCQALAPFRHTFSHYHLDIHPVVIELAKRPVKIMEDGGQIWYNPHKPDLIGLPKPIQTMMSAL